MQLKIKRNQRSAMLGGKVVFILDVMAELNREEKDLVDKYKLHKELVYSSDAAEHNAAMARAGNLKSLGAAVLDRATKRRFTLGDLVDGQHLECKDLGELVDTENQVYAACQTIRQYLDIAKSFDGSEQVVDIVAA